MRDIGKNIRYYREKKGYSQEQLAQLLFVTRQTVSNYETGRSRPDVETLVKLAGLLDIDVTDLIYGPRQISVSRRSLWLRLGAAIILFGIYLWLTPFSINYAAEQALEAQTHCLCQDGPLGLHCLACVLRHRCADLFLDGVF